RLQPYHVAIGLVGVAARFGLLAAALVARLTPKAAVDDHAVTVADTLVRLLAVGRLVAGGGRCTAGGPWRICIGRLFSTADLASSTAAAAAGRADPGCTVPFGNV